MRRYGWQLGWLLIVVMAGVMARLGVWQLSRLDERRAQNALVSARMAEAPLELGGAALPAAPEALEYRQAVARGTFDHEHEILLRSRAWGGRPGYHVVTPLLLADGAALLVDRGWVPLDQEGAAARAAMREPGEVAVQGRLRLSQQPGSGLGPVDEPPPGSAGLSQWFHLTIERVQQQLPYSVLPVYLERESAPAGLALPIPDAAVDLGEGPHLGYAIQWFCFAAIVLVGYAVLYRKRRRVQRSTFNVQG